MSIVVGLVGQDGKIYMSADSAGVSGNEISNHRAPKVFKKGEILIGFAGSFRVGQLIQYALTLLPVPHPAIPLEEYMVVHFGGALRSCLEENGVALTGGIMPGQLLVGLRGRLFRIGPDFAVAESTKKFDAIGSARQGALTALYATPEFEPRQRIQKALFACEDVYSDVGMPFEHLESEPFVEVDWQTARAWINGHDYGIVPLSFYARSQDNARAS